MAQLLLDTNALIWFETGRAMREEALLAIVGAQTAGTLFVSPITAWEAALAVRKKDPAKRPDLGGVDAASWFREARKRARARLILIGSRIALEVARVPAVFGHADPGDCFIIATAHVAKLAVVTRDRAVEALAAAQPDYLDVVPC